MLKIVSPSKLAWGASALKKGVGLKNRLCELQEKVKFEGRCVLYSYIKVRSNGGTH
jgi:hypothetical protein